MTKANKKLLPATYESSHLKRKTFSYTGDVHIHGNVVIKERLIVGGNLIVDGDLKANEIYCVGRITVGGNVEGSECYASILIHVDGNIKLSALVTGRDAEYIAAWIGLEDSYDEDNDTWQVDNLVDPLIYDDLEEQRVDQHQSNGTVSAGGFLHCHYLEAHGCVDVGKYFVCDDAEIEGCLSAESIYLEGELIAYGLVECRSGISCETLYASAIRCDGNLKGHTIDTYDGDIAALGYISTSSHITSVSGNIKAGKWIASAGKIESGAYIMAGEFVVADEGITTGADYGILAGLFLPRSQWTERGYISAPKKPRNILTGEFVAGKTWELVEAE